MIAISPKSSPVHFYSVNRSEFWTLKPEDILWFETKEAGEKTLKAMTESWAMPKERLYLLQPDELEQLLVLREISR